MHRKRSLIRVLARLMYASGLLFLISGLLLSAAYSPAAAAGDTQSRENFSSQPLQETMDPNCPCDTPTGPAPTSDNPTSSLAFKSGCHCSCDAVFATVCNLGGADMTSPVDWQLYYSASGNPSFGQVVDSGSLGPLGVNQCVDLNYPPNSAGLYAYRIEQEEGGSGPAVLWSNSCAVSGDCFAATATSTPFLPDTATPTETATGEPTATATDTAVATATGTAPAVVITLTPTETTPPPPTSTVESPPKPLDFNLSFVCGYAGDDYLLWWVSNTTSEDVDYIWRVSGSDEEGSGSVEAESVGYFTTSVGEKTVRLFIDGELVDSAVSDGPCKEYLTLSYTCTDDGSLLWVARNPNDFGVDYTWTIDGEEGGRGMLPANSSVQLTTTTDEEHTVELTWTDTRPGTHTVRLESEADSCDLPQTPTPTNTLPAPPVEITLTPTPTNTQVPPTNTPTNTPVVTNTPTNTQPPPVIVTNTPTNTPVVTNTPTNTAQPPIVITATNSPTRPVVVITNTPTNTPRPPVVIVTNTAQPPILITATNSPTRPVVVVTNTPTNTAQPPVVVITNTPTNTALPPVVVTATLQPPSIIIVTATSSPTVPVVQITPVATNTTAPPVIPSPTLITPVPLQLATATATATQIVTLAPPVLPTTTRTPVLIPVTGGDSTNYGTAVRLSLLGGLLTNTGLFVLGLALALTGIQTQLKQK